MWRASSPGVEQIHALRRARERLDLYPLAIHANYLVNLASADPLIRARSIASFRGELQRASALGAEYLVVHPGSYKGQSLEEGMAAFVLGLRDAAGDAAWDGVTVLLENTVGCGAQIGGRFEELRALRDSAAGLRQTVARAARTLGIGNVKLIHVNDSKMPLGSRVDRHANIGEGHIGGAGFRRILAHPELRAKPFILETPVDREGDDRRNLENLKRLCPKSRTTTPKSS